MDFGFVRVAAVVPRVKVADVNANVAEICRLAEDAERQEVSIAVFPELSVTGYTCADLFGQQLLIGKAEEGIKQLKSFSRGKKLTMVVGVPVRVDGNLYNCAAVIHNGKLSGLVPKIHLPGYNEFYESRWFSSGADFLYDTERATAPVYDDAKNCSSPAAGAEIVYAGAKVNVFPNLLFNVGRSTFAIEICEDLWTPVPPSSHHALAGADIILNLSASNEVLMKHKYRHELIGQQSARTVSAYVYSSCGYGESTQDLVFSGASMIYENGSLLAESERFMMEGNLIAADIDTEKLAILRQKQNTYHTVSPDGTRDGQDARRYVKINVCDGCQTDFEKCLKRHVEPHPFVPGFNVSIDSDSSEEELLKKTAAISERNARCREITDIQVMGLATRLAHINCKTAVIGISGGLDSTLALLVAVLAFDKLGWDRKRIIGITMPGLGTTVRTKSNAQDLMETLGVTAREIPIGKAVAQHFADIGQDPNVTDVTYENSQARERTQILMDVANKEGGIVIGTGDLSELALGWATYNGDHISMYGVNASIPKTLVKYLVGWAADNHFNENCCNAQRSVREILLDIIDTPISPELKPADNNGEITQKTEDLVGPYELHDFFLYNMFRFGYAPSKIYFLARKAFAGVYDDAVILKWLKTFISRFFGQQFKRSCLPDGPKVGSVSLSPRGDWRMPSDAWETMFLKDLENIEGVIDE